MEHRSFYDVTLKNFAMPWTNRDQTVFAPLNDYVATVIGMVRDDVPFNQVLYGDILYVGSGAGVPAYSPANNDHYAALERGVNLKTALTRTTQSGDERPARERHRRRHDDARRRGGVLHRRHQPGDVPLHADESHVPRHGAGAGHDAPARSHPPGREPQPRRRQPRVPQQLHRLPQRHGSDGAGLRLLRLDDETAGQHRLHAGVVRPKYFNNDDTFQPGFATPDDQLGQLLAARREQPARLGSAQPGSGQGAKSLGRELAGSEAFARCQVEKVFRNVCFRAPSDDGGPRRR